MLTLSTLTRYVYGVHTHRCKAEESDDKEADSEG